MDNRLSIIKILNAFSYNSQEIPDFLSVADVFFFLPFPNTD